MRKIFVHVGAPKTGTTLIQELLRANAGSLARHGLLYHAERFDEHFLAALDLLDKEWGGLEKEAAGRWDKLVGIINAWDGDAVISHEILAAATPEQVSRAMADLHGEVHVVMSVRDLARQIPAEWQELVKHRRTMTYRDFLTDLRRDQPEHEATEWFWRVQTWPDVLARWGAELPPEQVHVVTVPQPGAPRELLLHRVCRVFGIDRGWLEQTSDRTNVSLGADEVAVIRDLNERFASVSFRFKAYRYLVRELIAHRTLAARPHAHRLVLPPDMHDWAAALTGRWLEDVADRGYDVMGDSLHELKLPDLVEDEEFYDPDQVSAELKLAVTNEALDALLLEAGMLELEVTNREARLVEAEARVTQLERRVHHHRRRLAEVEERERPVMRFKQRFVAASAHNRAYAAALRVYRWMFRRGRS